MAVRKGFIDTEKQKRDSSSVVRVYSDVHRDRFVCICTCMFRLFLSIIMVNSSYKDHEMMMPICG